MAEDVRVPAEQVPRKGRSIVVKVPEREGAGSTKDVVIFNTGEEYLAVENRCPHKGWPLAGGKIEGCEVRCPWHGWCINLKSGEVNDMEDMCCSRLCTAFRAPRLVATFSVRKEGDSLIVGRNVA